MTTTLNTPTYHTISWSELYHLKSTAQEVLAKPMDDPNTAPLVATWHMIAQNLNKSISASPPFYRYILDILTLHIVKKWILKWLLPDMLNQLQAKTNATAQKYLNPQSMSSAHFTPEQKTTLKVLLQAQEHFKQHRVKILEDLSGYFALAKIVDPTAPTADDVEKQVNQYFQEKFELLFLHDANPPLPRWYHATHHINTLAKIVSENTLKMNDAAAGTGVCFSTKHEKEGPEFRYGSYCFALDHRFIAPLPVSYFPSRNNRNQELWITVQRDVPVIWDDLAHIIVNSKQEEQNLKEILATKYDLTDPSAIAITAPIVYSETHDILHKCFRAAFEKPTLPAHWKRHEWVQSIYRIRSGEPLPAALPCQETPEQQNSFIPRR